MLRSNQGSLSDHITFYTACWTSFLDLDLHFGWISATDLESMLDISLNLGYKISRGPISGSAEYFKQDSGGKKKRGGGAGAVTISHDWLVSCDNKNHNNDKNNICFQV